MSDELTLPAHEPTTAPVATSPADTEPSPLPPEATTGATTEGGTRAVLRGAIQKVMDEIQHHEREAKRHLQQAQDLRKELRESVAFLQAGGQAAKAAEAAKVSEPTPKGRARDTDDKAHRAAGKKGSAVKRK